MATTKAAPPRVVVVGLGIMGSHHCRVLTSLSGAELVAAVDPDGRRRSAIGTSFPGVSTYVSLAEALAAEELDIACIATPVDRLAGCAVEALEAELHVLLEKPTARSEQDGLAVADEARERGLIVGVGHVERFNPAVLLLKSKLAGGGDGGG